MLSLIHISFTANSTESLNIAIKGLIRPFMAIFKLSVELAVKEMCIRDSIYQVTGAVKNTDKENRECMDDKPHSKGI